MVAIQKIISYLIPLLVLVIFLWFYYNPEGSFENLKEVVSGVKGYVKIGAKEVSGEKPVIPRGHQEAIDNLKRTMEEMRDSKRKNCFEIYGSLPALGDKGTKIVLSYNADKDSTSLIVFGGKEGQQEVSYTEIEHVKPCVIAGSEEVVENFGASFLNDKDWKDKTIVSGHFRSVNQIEIFSVSDRNVIRVPEFSSNVVNDVNDNLWDYGILYTPDDKNICFFPTVLGNPICDGSDEGGLDNDCLGEDPKEDISIPNQIKVGVGGLITCTGPLPEAYPPEGEGERITND